MNELKRNMKHMKQRLSKMQKLKLIYLGWV